MAIYGLEIETEDLQDQFMNEVANEIIIPDSTIIDGSVPEFQANADDTANDIYGMGYKSGVVPSGIPGAIDKLWNYHNRVPDIDPPVAPVLKLRNFLNDDYILQDKFNGACIDLDTTGYKVIIGPGSTLLAL